MRDIVQKVLGPEWIKRANSAKVVQQSSCMNQDPTHFVVVVDNQTGYMWCRPVFESKVDAVLKIIKDLVTGDWHTVPHILEAEA